MMFSVSRVGVLTNPAVCHFSTSTTVAATGGGRVLALPFRSLSSYSLQSVRAQSSDSQIINARPAYQIYGENVAFSIKPIPPEFRAVSGGKTVVLDGTKKGRLMLEWVPRISIPGQNKFAWDRPLRFALTPEEIGLVLTRLKQEKSVELNRHLRTTTGDYGDYFSNNNNNTNDDDNMDSLMKVFRAETLPNGSIRFVCDHEKDGRGGQDPPSQNESKGPLEIDLMVGEGFVVQSLMEYSIPRLTGWSTMLDHSMDQAFRASTAFVPNPHNYISRGRGGGGGGREDGVPF